MDRRVPPPQAPCPRRSSTYGISNDGEISDTALSEDITETSENISDAKPLTDGDASGANETAENSDTECDSEREAHDGSSEGESE